MLQKKTLETILSDLLGEHLLDISEFIFNFLKYNKEIDIRTRFNYLQNIGINRKGIAPYVSLLGFDSEIIQKNYDNSQYRNSWNESRNNSNKLQ